MSDSVVPSVCVISLGCKVNRVESDAVESSFERRGCRLVDLDEADLVVINTCAVTAEAQAKTRKAIRRAHGASRKPCVCISGCAANLFPEELGHLVSDSFIISDKDRLAEKALGLWREMRADKSTSCPAFSDNDAEPTVKTGSKQRRGIKVQDGCDNRCTYCIVWKARGPSRSYELSEIEQQVKTVLAQGAHEVVLSGINLATYHATDPVSGNVIDLAGLIDKVCSWGPDLLRISSLEPEDLQVSVLEAMVRSGGRVAPHLHIPLQAGSDRTLSRMKRRYTRAEYEALVRTIRTYIPQISLSTDIIVGFPQESDEDFEETLDVCSRVSFSKIHVFRFSARPGTPAADMPGQIDPCRIKERADHLSKLGMQLRRGDALKRVGSVEPALIESVDKDMSGRGTTASYHRFVIPECPVGACGVHQIRLNSFDESTMNFEAVLLS